MGRDGIPPLLLSSFVEKTAACHANAFDNKGSKMKAWFDAVVAMTEAEKNAKMTEITATSTEGFKEWDDHLKRHHQITTAQPEKVEKGEDIDNVTDCGGGISAKAYCQVHGNVVRKGHAPP